MNYYNKNWTSEETSNKHLSNLIEWLFTEVISAGGDGDGLWYSTIYTVGEIKNYVEDNNLIPKGWTTRMHDDRTVCFEKGQECLIVTNNEEVFNNRPSWQQVSLVY